MIDKLNNYKQYPGFFLHISLLIPAKEIKYFAKSLYIDNPSPFSHFPINWWINLGLYNFNTIPSSDPGFSGRNFDNSLLNHLLNSKYFSNFHES